MSSSGARILDARRLAVKPRAGDDINMRSAWVCSRNDVIVNAGVLVAAGAVALTGPPWRDVIAGLLVAAAFVRSAAHVIGEASRAGALSR